MDSAKTLQDRLEPKQLKKLTDLNNAKLNDFVAKYVELCDPKSVFVCTDADEDVQYIRDAAVKNGEERKLATEGHTVHFDGFVNAEINDQARDKKNTKILVPEGMTISEVINTMDKKEGLSEIHDKLKGLMKDHEMYVLFFCLGPIDSEFSISCAQITDSSYVAHSEFMLYRCGYEQFRKLNGSGDFFRFTHSQGELVGGVSKNIRDRRIYVDLEDGIVFSTNTQYAGNTVGLKKLAHRLALYKASREKWLSEHMFVMGVHGPNDRVTYFAGAYPSACGKTSTAMITGETIIGDDLAYLRKIDGQARTVNVESGIFGIIGDVDAENDPVIFQALVEPGEVIFSNVLITEDNLPYWPGRDRDNVPEKGINFSGEWHKGKTDSLGKPIAAAHKNARFTVRLSALSNLDERADDPKGVPVGGIIYGGRDSDTSVPVEQSFDWSHGIITKGAFLESETTAATIGTQGVRAFSPMSNIDFIPIPLGQYILNNIEFGESLESPPLIFSVNYFIKGKDGKFLTSMQDKCVWVKWMERRVHGEVDVVQTPTGMIPKYEDLKSLFREVLGRDYTEEQYVEQFTLRIPENLAKLDRIEEIYKTKVPDTPDILFKTLNDQRQRLNDAKSKQGAYVSPLKK